MEIVQKYRVGDILYNFETKRIFEIVDNYKEFEYYCIYMYKLKDLETNEMEKFDYPQSGLDRAFVTQKIIEDNIYLAEKEVGKVIDHIDSLKWLREEMKNKLKLVDREDNKR